MVLNCAPDKNSKRYVIPLEERNHRYLRIPRTIPGATDIGHLQTVPPHSTVPPPKSVILVDESSRSANMNLKHYQQFTIAWRARSTDEEAFPSHDISVVHIVDPGNSLSEISDGGLGVSGKCYFRNGGLIVLKFQCRGAAVNTDFIVALGTNFSGTAIVCDVLADPEELSDDARAIYVSYDASWPDIPAALEEFRHARGSRRHIPRQRLDRITKDFRSGHQISLVVRRVGRIDKVDDSGRRMYEVDITVKKRAHSGVGGGEEPQKAAGDETRTS